MTIGRIPSVEGGIQPTIFDAKADILTATAADTPARLAVGANDTVLTADSSTATGLKWASVSSGGMTLLSTTTLSGASTTVSGISASYTHLLIFVYGITTAVNSYCTFDPNASLANAYYQRERNTSSSAWELTTQENTPAYIWAQTNNKENNANQSSVVWLYNYTGGTSIPKDFNIQTVYRDSGNTYYAQYFNRGTYFNEAAVSSIKFATGSTFSTGTVKIYGVK
jgi:hypothetical protein